jgi:hypothetical protein
MADELEANDLRKPSHVERFHVRQIKVERNYLHTVRLQPHHVSASDA